MGQPDQLGPTCQGGTVMTTITPDHLAQICKGVHTATSAHSPNVEVATRSQTVSPKTHTLSGMTGPRKLSLPAPVSVEALILLLDGYVDRDFIIEGFSNGFFIYFDGEECDTMAHNNLSFRENLKVGMEKINEEIQLGRIKGPFKEKPFDKFKISPLALREKSTPGTYRLLHNLSHPYDLRAVNVGIPQRFKSVK